MTPSAAYWEQRARRFARSRTGLRAVCSYGMPGFYNAAIHLAQCLALDPWIAVEPGTDVLDVGCGVGRWSVRLARGGARVTGVDLSATMIEQARHHAQKAGLADRCAFRQGDVASFDLARRFPLVMGVTVLQHIVDDGAFLAAIRNLAQHLEPDGRLVLLEVAPDRGGHRHGHSFLRVRSRADYITGFEEAGLRTVAVTGVDALPLRVMLRPAIDRLPTTAAVPAWATVVLLGLPIELVFGRLWTGASWHKVFVLTHR